MKPKTSLRSLLLRAQLTNCMATKVCLPWKQRCFLPSSLTPWINPFHWADPNLSSIKKPSICQATKVWELPPASYWSCRPPNSPKNPSRRSSDPAQRTSSARFLWALLDVYMFGPCWPKLTKPKSFCKWGPTRICGMDPFSIPGFPCSSCRGNCVFLFPVDIMSHLWSVDINKT